jgi:hypothetical protein
MSELVVIGDQVLEESVTMTHSSPTTFPSAANTPEHETEPKAEKFALPRAPTVATAEMLALSDATNPPFAERIDVAFMPPIDVLTLIESAVKLDDAEKEPLEVFISIAFELIDATDAMLAGDVLTLIAAVEHNPVPFIDAEPNSSIASPTAYPYSQ